MNIRWLAIQRQVPNSQCSRLCPHYDHKYNNTVHYAIYKALWCHNQMRCSTPNVSVFLLNLHHVFRLDIRKNCGYCQLQEYLVTKLSLCTCSKRCYRFSGVFCQHCRPRLRQIFPKSGIHNTNDKDQILCGRKSRRMFSFFSTTKIRVFIQEIILPEKIICMSTIFTGLSKD